MFFKYKCIKGILFTFYPTSIDVRICCGMAVGLRRWNALLDDLGKLGKLGCGSLCDIKSIPQFVAGASLSVLTGFSCVLG